MGMHICAVSPEPFLLAWKEVDEDLDQVLDPHRDSTFKAWL